MDNFLATVEPSKHLAPADRQRLARVAAEKRYERGETLYREGQTSDASASRSTRR